MIQLQLLYDEESEQLEGASSTQESCSGRMRRHVAGVEEEVSRRCVSEVEMKMMERELWDNWDNNKEKGKGCSLEADREQQGSTTNPGEK